ncbi:helix-turn-helix transcriptional regulator [Granulicella sp. WH15]|uniref:helix-turn-helix transcriptional regulator n=1 Tax=Granulicella sp. WH15 TaxID=2602070 RepID=UPI0013A5933F|nr:helix-turn-helix transcriptional regulator [Granulicella sp. WH15]
MFENPEAAFGSTNHLLELIETIYAAVQQPELWTNVLEGIARNIHGESTTLFARMPDDQLFSMTRTDPDAWNAYAGYYSAVNPLMQRCDAMFVDGEVRYAHHAMPDRDLVKTEFYNDFFVPYDMHYSMGIKVPLRGDLPAAYITCQRPHAKGPFKEHEGLVYQTLLPHLRRALSLHLQLMQTNSRILGLEAALNAFDHAVLGLDQDGKVIFTSGKAEALVLADDGVRILNRQLALLDSAQNTRIRTAIAEAINGQFAVSPASTSLLVRRRSQAAPLQLTVVPYRSLLPGCSMLAALVFIGDPTLRPPSKAAILRALYGLTPSEARLADLLAEGLTLQEAAGRLRLALETVRFHSKRIFAKTGARRQAELMKLMLTLPSV